MAQQNRISPFSILANAPVPFAISIRTGKWTRRFVVFILSLRNQPACSHDHDLLLKHIYSLTTWLAHSKKKTCDVCKAEYAFEKGMFHDRHTLRRCYMIERFLS